MPVRQLKVFGIMFLLMTQTRLNRFITSVMAFVMIAGFVPAANAQDGGSLAAQATKLPATVNVSAGESVEVTVILKNTGSSTWVNKGANATKIGTIEPYDRQSLLYDSGWMSGNRVAVAKEDQVKPGKTGTFKFKVGGGGPGGLVKEKFGLVTEGVAWAGLSFELSAQVQAGSYGAELRSEPVISLELKAGEVKTITTKVRNTGITRWQGGPGSAVKLGTVTPFDHKGIFKSGTWLSSNRVASVEKPVKSGEEGTVTWEVQAPIAAGNYQEEFGLVAEGVSWMAPRVTVNMKVVPAVHQAQWVKQSPTVSLAPGETAELWVEYRNTGNVAWKADGSTPVRLGTAKPQDRVSRFADTSWIQPNRPAALSPATVNPGEVGRFSFKITGAGTVGKYKEYFQPVMENVTWLADAGLYWDINVEEEMSIQSLLRVGITSTTDPITVSGDGFVIRKGDGGSLVRKYDKGSVTINPVSGGYKLSTGETVKDYLEIVPVNKAVLTVSTSGISSSYNTFRGTIVIQRSVLNNVWVVNHVDLEDYLKGIAEVPDSWPKQAQMAQMVAARTYAVKKRSESVKADIFDVYDDTRSQVYYGYDYEVAKPSLTAAAVATKGLVIKHGGQPISAYFFSDSGGATEASYNVWGKGNSALSIPYLQGVKDPYAKPIEWTVTLTQDYLKSRFDEDLNIAATGSDNITDIEITERFPSDRIKTAVFTLSSGKEVEVPFYRFDYLTNNNDVKSMNFKVHAGSGSSPDFTFTGLGWGHGVGMPQWSAKNMADKGKDFREILSYFFTGVSIEPV